jgi:dephospho-CoA kinase
MIIIGLTGSIGMGKSTTLAMFADEGIPVFSADTAVHGLYEAEAVPLIEAAFPGATANGKVDRVKLSAAVFGNPESLRRLEAIVHPLVRKKELDFVEQARQSGVALAVIDIPLLFETGGEQRFDKIVLVTADPHTQRERVSARPGMSGQKLDAILARQMPDADKRTKAHYIIDTAKGLDAARQSVRAIIRTINESRTHA